jgi:PEP-CTERM motif
VRTRETNARAAELGGVETSDHLARLWAADRIDALLRAPSGAPPTVADRKQALALAAQYHLVTAVSGAVVLDTQAATDAVAGSDPETNVPTVPEPETWALLALVALLLMLAVRARRRLPPAGMHAA